MRPGSAKGMAVPIAATIPQFCILVCLGAVVQWKYILRILNIDVATDLAANMPGPFPTRCGTAPCGRPIRHWRTHPLTEPPLPAYRPTCTAPSADAARLAHAIGNSCQPTIMKQPTYAQQSHALLCLEYVQNIVRAASRSPRSTDADAGGYDPEEMALLNSRLCTEEFNFFYRSLL
jgi:hypothetical protein